MKNVILISILILLFSCKTHSKNETLEYTIINKNAISDFKKELKIYTKIQELRNKKIDFIEYKQHSIGSIRLSRTDDLNNCPSCISNFSIYLIWREKENQYIQIFDNCGSFLPVNIENTNILEFANKNFNIINLERIKYYQVDKKTVSMISHSEFKDFLLSRQGTEIYNHFDVYNLTTNSEKPNLNYKYNQNLKIIELNNLIEEKLEKIETKNFFTRDLSKCK